MNEPLPGPRGFATTHWSLVLAATSDEASQGRARAALEQLCRDYWYPLYAFVRQRGVESHEAQDLTQSFFARLIEKGGLASADPDRGRPACPAAAGTGCAGPCAADRGRRQDLAEALRRCGAGWAYLHGFHGGGGCAGHRLSGCAEDDVTPSAPQDRSRGRRSGDSKCNRP